VQCAQFLKLHFLWPKPLFLLFRVTRCFRV
jgi:hypothetical protein